MATMSSAAVVFAIPELLEQILLSLPMDKFYEEIDSMRFILFNQTVCRTWRSLTLHSTPLRQVLYLPTPCDVEDSKDWLQASTIPPARPNPWIPHLLLNKRSWGTSYPFDNTYSVHNLYPSRPKLWTFALEISRVDCERFPQDYGESWRSMMISSSPFTCMWYTRAFYELGSGRAPFVTYLDYKPGVSKSQQKLVKRREEGITLGDLVEAVSEAFSIDHSTKWVRIESVRVDTGSEQIEDPTLNTPATRDILPVASAMLWTEHYES